MAARQQYQPAPSNTYFHDEAGIDRDVITTEITRFLGGNALVRPGMVQGRRGYLITAYRDLTDAQLQDIKELSARYLSERRRRTEASHAAPSYADSATRRDGQSQPREQAQPPQPYDYGGRPAAQPGYQQAQSQYNPYPQPAAGYAGSEYSQYATYPAGTGQPYPQAGAQQYYRDQAAPRTAETREQPQGTGQYYGYQQNPGPNAPPRPQYTDSAGRPVYGYPPPPA